MSHPNWAGSPNCTSRSIGLMLSYSKRCLYSCPITGRLFFLWKDETNIISAVCGVGAGLGVWGGGWWQLHTLQGHRGETVPLTQKVPLPEDPLHCAHHPLPRTHRFQHHLTHLQNVLFLSYTYPRMLLILLLDCIIIIVVLSLGIYSLKSSELLNMQLDRDESKRVCALF